MRAPLFFLLLTVLALLPPAHADPIGEPRLVKDISPGGASSSLLLFTSVQGTVFFRASDGTHGLELWKSDGTEAGTVLVKDIWPGSQHSDLERFFEFDGTLYFVADDGVSGLELWKSDGTAAGTVLVKDIQPGSGSSRPAGFIVVNGKLFFDATEATTGTELWTTDGTAVGTVLVKDIFPGAGSVPAALASSGGTLFLKAFDNAHGSELWKSDGTAAGTVLLKDIRPGTGFSFPSDMTDVNGTLFFVADDGSGGRELWKSDGTVAGTVLVKDINPGPTGSGTFSDRLTNVGGVLYFVADDGSGGRELWKSDGTATGTVLVKDINSGATGSSPDLLTDVAGTLYFTADDGTSGRELWTSDGTAVGTYLVKNINAGALSANPGFLTDANGCLLFRADDGVAGMELWTSDGTAAGTVLVEDIRSGSRGSFPAGARGVARHGAFFGVANGTVYFAATANAGRELWAVDVATNAPSADAVCEQLTDIGAQAVVRLDGSGSSDAQDAFSALSFKWTVDGLTICEGPAAACAVITVSLSFGPHQVILRVTNSDGAFDVVTKEITIDPARLAVLEIERAKVEFAHSPPRLRLRGEIGLPSGVGFSELSPTAVAGVVLAGNPVLALTPVAFTVGGGGQEWKFRDPLATAGITKFDIDWKGARFRFHQSSFPVELRSQIITSSETILTLKFKPGDINGPFSMDLGGLATVDVDAAGVVTATVPVEVEEPGREVTLTLPFPLVDTMVITLSGSVALAIPVGSHLQGSIGRYRIDVLFDGALFPAGTATLPRTLDLAMLVGAQGYDGTAALGPAELLVKDDKWEAKR